MFKKSDDSLRSAGKIIGLGTLGVTGVYVLGRFLFKKFIRGAATKMLTESYGENVFEMYNATKRINPIIIVDTSLRAGSGKALMRPLGTPFPKPDFSSIAFNSAQMYRFPTPSDVEIDTTLVLGKKAAKPLKLDIPILFAGMGWGMGLSKQAKLALAGAATEVGTACNTGDGPFADWERAAAKHLIVQYPRVKWNHDPAILRQANMIEIQIGHCGWVGIGSKYGYDELSPILRKSLGLKRGEDAVYHARFPEISKSQDLGLLVSDLRKISGGVPIGVKMTCGADIERDLAIVLEAGVDVISIDGAHAASHSSPAILHDNFTLPAVYALCRASRFLDKEKVRDRVSLLIGGGLETPGDFLKALALGADGVYIGTIALFAMLYDQEFKALPYEPPTQLLWNTGKYKNKFDHKKGARHLAYFLRACVEEMRMATRGIGKTALRDVSKEDLFAISEEAAKIANIPLGYQSPL